MLGMQDWNGWWYYFPVAFLLKTSIPIVLVSIAAFLWGIERTVRRRSMSHLVLVAPMGLYAVMAMRSQINIGIRHFLPQLYAQSPRATQLLTQVLIFAVPLYIAASYLGWISL